MVELPRILEVARATDSVRLDLQVPAGLACFEGHFPGHPLVPGVVQVAWAVACARRYLAAPDAVARVDALKFQQMILPGASIGLEMQRDPGTSVVRFRIRSGAGVHASGVLRFEETP